MEYSQKGRFTPAFLFNDYPLNNFEIRLNTKFISKGNGTNLNYVSLKKTL